MLQALSYKLQAVFFSFIINLQVTSYIFQVYLYIYKLQVLIFKLAYKFTIYKHYLYINLPLKRYIFQASFINLQAKSCFFKYLINLHIKSSVYWLQVMIY
jgi:hypothetical protein